jgi:negative regulator of sigma E activity
MVKEPGRYGLQVAADWAALLGPLLAVAAIVAAVWLGVRQINAALKASAEQVAASLKVGADQVEVMRLQIAHAEQATAEDRLAAEQMKAAAERDRLNCSVTAHLLLDQGTRRAAFVYPRAAWPQRGERRMWTSECSVRSR